MWCGRRSRVRGALLILASPPPACMEMGRNGFGFRAARPGLIGHSSDPHVIEAEAGGLGDAHHLNRLAFVLDLKPGLRGQLLQG